MQITASHMMTQAMNQFQLRFAESGFVRTDVHWAADHVRSPYTRLYYVTAGCGVLRTGSGEIPLEPGNLYLIPAGYEFGYRSPEWLEKLYFHINLLLPDGCELLTALHSVLQCPYPVQDTERLCAWYFGGTYLDAMQLQARIKTTVISLLAKQGFTAPPIVIYSEDVARAMQYILQHLSLQLTSASIAENLFLSESQLARRFRSEVGRTVSRYIDDLIFFSAQMQLASTERTIGEISEALGFCDQFYFSRRFHRRFGVTPRCYRARLQMEYRAGRTERLEAP